MSKSERNRFFQPIPLSLILDPTYQTPFSKLEQFQLDMEISKIRQQERPSLLKKLQATLANAMSNLVVISHPVFASSVCRTTNMSLVPWRSFKSCKLSESSENISDSSLSSPVKSPSESQSIYHSVRTGLEYLRYFATHRLQEEKLKIHDCKKIISIYEQKLNATLVPRGSSIDYCFPISFLRTYSSSCSLSTGQDRTGPNLFALAMTGCVFSSTHNLNTFYKNSYLLSPVHIKGATAAAMMFQSDRCASAPVSPQKFSNMEIPGSNIEIYIHSTSHPNQECSGLNVCHGNTSSTPQPSSPTKQMDSSQQNEIGGGCIRIETNWRSKRTDDNLANLHSVSVCSASSSKGGTLTFACTSLSSSPRNMAASCGRRRKTESESSTDSFIEFSASVESTDSFCIVFESAGGSCLDEDPEDDEWEDDADDDDDSDEDDQIFNYSASDDLDGEIFQTDLDDVVTDARLPDRDEVDFVMTSPAGTKKKLKKVSFAKENLVNVIELEDDIDSKKARETYWEVFARDRARFQDRIFRTGEVLEPILATSHRLKVYSQRFSDEN